MYRDAPPGSTLLVVAFKNKVFAVDRATGEQRWRAVLHEWADSDELVELAIDERIVIACSASYLAFLEYATGTVVRQVKRHDIGRGHRPHLLVDGGQLFIGGGGVVVCYDLDGQLRWAQAFDADRYGIRSIALGLPHRVRQADDVGSR